jgi:hypothetical protein
MRFTSSAACGLLATTAVAACLCTAGCDGKNEWGEPSDAGQPHKHGDGGSHEAHADAGSDAGRDAGASRPRTDSNIQTVFLILMENKTWTQLKGSPDAPFLNDVLLPEASIATNYKGPWNGTLHPSEPNYVWLEAGSDLGIADDADPYFNHQPTTDHLVSRLESAGLDWKSYQEDIRGDECPLSISGTYDPKHNPMVFFDDITDENDVLSAHCITHVRPLEELRADLEDESRVARYNFITPNLCNDMHTECDPHNNLIRQGDEWLARWIPRIQASTAYKDGGAIFITWDEATTTKECPSADCPIGMFVLSPFAKGHGYESSIAYDHSSTLKSMQEIFEVKPFMRAASGREVADLADLFEVFP